MPSPVNKGPPANHRTVPGATGRCQLPQEGARYLVPQDGAWYLAPRVFVPCSVGICGGILFYVLWGFG